MYIILVYDIVMDDDGPKVQRKILKLCKRYLHHIQGSVFEGELRDSQYKEFNKELSKYMRKDKDSIIIYKINNKNWLNREILTNIEDKTDNYI